MNQTEQRANIKQFIENWKDRGDEKQHTHRFWTALLQDVLGVEKVSEFIEFEKTVKSEHTNFIDGYIPKTKVLIEQKSANVNLDHGQKQSDGVLLTPFQQARRYAANLPHDEHPRWIVVSNFKEFRIHDMNKPNDAPEIILLTELEKEYHRFSFLTELGNEHLEKELELSIAAGDIVGRLYDAILEQYTDKTNPETLKSLNILCVRFVFCLYAEDAGIFDVKNQFYEYLKDYDAPKMRGALIELFKVLNTPENERDKYMLPELAAFPYVNGGLFADVQIEIPLFTDKIRTLLLKNASLDFDWSEISPTIFGAVFESTLNPETRRSGGMHYTSIENIHKVIDPLFLNDLKAELEEIKQIPSEKKRANELKLFQDKLASLRWLDPASGSGNFLTETYLSIRRLENEALKVLTKGQISIGDENITPIKVSISQFYGIEINDFAVTVAKTALWIAESQMLKETEDIVHMQLDFLPLKTSANIVEGNALTMDWNDVIPKHELNYIMGNPPFSGARVMKPEQKQELMCVFTGWKNAGNLDYVSCWYKKAADYMRNTNIDAALVSTSSIVQGDSVAILWKPLFKEGLNIDFAYRAFKWESEAKNKAQVHCVIIGFSMDHDSKPKYIYTAAGRIEAKNINAYLTDSENIFVESRQKPLCNVPGIGIGNKPIDGGNYLFTEDEMKTFIKDEPSSTKYFRSWYGAQEFINQKPRYCLWLGDCTPDEIKKMPKCAERVKAVREFRLKSKSAGTVKLADKPTRFHVENMPKDNFIIIPEVTSENRKYIPIGLMAPDSLVSNKVFALQDTSLYFFGILTSGVHMAWTRAVCGRHGNGYNYSKDIVYNNFPWPNPTPEQKLKIEKTAQAILDARAKYPNTSFAALYDDDFMPAELRKAHQLNDKAVLEAYGIKPNMPEYTDEATCVAMLFRLYEDLTKDKN